MGSIQPEEIDVLLVGAGFASFTMLNKLRKQGLKCKIYEKGSKSGGVWYWNNYPGARVDSPAPIYQLYDKELWEDFTFTEKYPGGKEIRRYFEHVEKKWDVRKDIEFDKHVDGATFDKQRNQWLVECSDGSEVYCRWLILCIGFASRRFTPPFNGLSNYKGDTYHTAVWPQHGVNLKNKRVGVVGTGATGIQVIQTIGPVVNHLTVYQRTPNFTLPMNQGLLEPEEEAKKKTEGKYEEEFTKTRKTFAGFPFTFAEKNTFDDTPEEREVHYDNLMNKQGGFHYWLGNYKDLFFDQKANDEAYKFWRKTVCKRIPDIKKRELLAPEIPPHPWGAKRPSLEQNVYEVFSLPHVDIIDVNESPILEVTEKGIRTKDGEVEFDVLILATGFDSLTGSLAQLNIRGIDGHTIAQKWKDGTRTSMGIAMNNFPNMFYLYGVHAPTAFANGPSCVQSQAEHISETLRGLTEKNKIYFEAKEEAEEDWCKRLNEVWSNSLFPQAKSWYQGANIPGRKVEPLSWLGGIPEYMATLARSNENDYQGWITK
ncbi:b13af049-c611-46d5-9c7a-767081e2ecbd [Sclerotinia trifoliorum]|uniref:B13af049-c611-46d5-9c7a-767081e2ecbd n=1 Tax=Sclerotinia trifoliorum TaxID=28548 RepID=A0A8H2VYH9_9HELO|nr:b13af049-c611-46d5-9c7a-767081e2ecbd [Sclerotinia trifoliorum]